VKLSVEQKRKRALAVIGLLRKATANLQKPAVSHVVSRFGRDPFPILISCLLSLRAKDTASLPIALKLLERAKTPQEILKIPRSELEKLFYSVGYYRQKAKTIHEVCLELIERFDGKVPNNQQDLLSIKGVGIKTANLVLGEGFGIPAICVDIHVHRISNRLGLVQTKTAEQTEAALREILPQEYWIEYNHLLVMWGQNVCVPVSPFCSRCVLSDICPKVGVTRRR
jgi:endonuclease III